MFQAGSGSSSGSGGGDASAANQVALSAAVGALASAKTVDPDEPSANLNALSRGSLKGINDCILALGQIRDAQGIVTVGGTTPRITAQLVRPSDATQYSIGDIIANSGTGASVVPITFSNAARISGGSGRLTGCRCVVTAASGTIVLPKFDLLIFRPVTSIPFAAAGYPADNAALNISAAAMKEKTAIFSFLDTGWRNQAGGTTAAGDHVYQSVLLSSGRAFAPFNLASIPSTDLVGVLQVQNTWNPGAVVNTIDFVLDTDQD